MDKKAVLISAVIHHFGETEAKCEFSSPAGPAAKVISLASKSSLNFYTQLGICSSPFLYFLLFEDLVSVACPVALSIAAAVERAVIQSACRSTGISRVPKFSKLSDFLPASKSKSRPHPAEAAAACPQLSYISLFAKISRREIISFTSRRAE